MALLAMLAWWLLRLHLQEDWWLGAPLASHWRWAAGSLAAYTALCTLLWWRGRTRDDAGNAAGEAPTLLVWASQTGFAQQLCERSAEVLRAAGLPVRVRGLHQVDAAVLQQTTRLLLIASTTGEGDPPDHTLPFLRRVMPQDLALPQLHYGVLALGDRSYGQDVYKRQEYHRPYVAVWLEGADQKVAANLAVWYQQTGNSEGQGTKWLPDLRQWWRKSGRTLDLPVDGVTGPTKPAGTHALSFTDKQPALKALAPGNYTLVVEAVREVGGRELVKIPFTWPATAPQSGKAQGSTELGLVTLSSKP